MQKLKPCPFCGRNVMINVIPQRTETRTMGTYSYNQYAARCEYCEVEMSGTDRSQIEKRWNQRSAPVDPVLMRPSWFVHPPIGSVEEMQKLALQGPVAQLHEPDPAEAGV